MVLRKMSDNSDIQGLLSKSHIPRGAYYDSGLSILARLIASRILSTHSKQQEGRDTMSCHSGLDSIADEKERTDELENDAKNIVEDQRI